MAGSTELWEPRGPPHADRRPRLTWTVDPTSVTVQVVRFYLPAIGAIALLGAWMVTRIPGPAWLAGLTTAAVITAMFGLGVWSFYAMYAALGVDLSG